MKTQKNNYSKTPLYFLYDPPHPSLSWWASSGKWFFRNG